jgi:hypothetical protein
MRALLVLTSLLQALSVSASYRIDDGNSTIEYTNGGGGFWYREPNDTISARAYNQTLYEFFELHVALVSYR